MNRMKIDIFEVSEISCPKSGDFCSGDHRIIHTDASKKKTDTVV